MLESSIQEASVAASYEACANSGELVCGGRISSCIINCLNAPCPTLCYTSLQSCFSFPRRHQSLLSMTITNVITCCGSYIAIMASFVCSIAKAAFGGTASALFFLHAVPVQHSKAFSTIWPKHGVLPLQLSDPSQQRPQTYVSVLAGSLYRLRTKDFSLHRAPFDPAPFPDRSRLGTSWAQ